MYLSDLHLGESAGPIERLFAGALGLFVRGRIHFHFADAVAAERELAIAGFTRAELIDPSTRDLPDLDRVSAGFVRVVRATTGSDRPA
jgi:hypothetical protein